MTEGPNGETWWSRTESAELIGVSPRWFSEAVQPLIPDAGRRGRGKSLEFLGREVLSAYLRLVCRQEGVCPECKQPLRQRAAQT